uniref:HAT C-terminal dimerisation domain-containing protein n=1 Tax=Octopus bimaculoides TaxID=37653 RepID=A0A0L8H400_OCTBM
MCNLDNWKRKANIKNIAMFEKLLSILAAELCNNELDLVQNLFKLLMVKVPDDCQDEFLELKSDSQARDVFDQNSVTKFWPFMCNSYLEVAETAIHSLLPSVSSYLYKSGFSTLLQMKMK